MKEKLLSAFSLLKNRKIMNLKKIAKIESFKSIKNIYVHKPMTKFSFLQKHDSNHENKTTLKENLGLSNTRYI